LITYFYQNKIYSMKYRLAKTIDIDQIVNLHYSVREGYNIGIFAQLGKSFLKQYYKIIINDQDGVVVCAVDDFGKIQGFCSATLDVESLFINIRSKKFILGLAAIKSIIYKPSLLKSLFQRYNSTKGKNINNYIASSGPRLEYWAWSLTNKDSFSSIEMHEILLSILQDLGVKTLNFEVDTINKKIYLFHQYNGAELIELKVLPDGRERAIMKYNIVGRKKQ